jgi:hypothetical protein
MSHVVLFSSDNVISYFAILCRFKDVCSLCYLLVSLVGVILLLLHCIVTFLVKLRRQLLLYNFLFYLF